MNHDPDPGGNVDVGQFRSHDNHVIVTVEDRGGLDVLHCRDAQTLSKKGIWLCKDFK